MIAATNKKNIIFTYYTHTYHLTFHTCDNLVIIIKKKERRKILNFMLYNIVISNKKVKEDRGNTTY